MSAILYEHGFSNGYGVTATRTQSTELTAGAGRKHVICSINLDSGKLTDSATYDGVAMTRIGTRQTYSSMTQDWFYYDIPDAKSAAFYDVVLAFSTSASDNNVIVGWTTQNNATGAPVLVAATQAAGTATVAASIATVSGDALMAVPMRATTSSTSWTSCTSGQLTFSSITDQSSTGRRVGRAHAIGDATETVTATWATNDAADDLLMTLINTTPASGGGGLDAATLVQYRRTQLLMVD